MKTTISTRSCIGLALALAGALGAATGAQAQGRIAIYPAVFDNAGGAAEARAEAARIMRTTLEQAGFTVVDAATARSTWSSLGLSMPAPGAAPTMADATRFGRAASADYVVAPDFDYEANRTWNTAGRYTTIKATMNVFKVSDGSLIYNRTETLSKTALASGDFASLSIEQREERVTDMVVDVTLAGFIRMTHPVTL